MPSNDRPSLSHRTDHRIRHAVDCVALTCRVPERASQARPRARPCASRPVPGRPAAAATAAGSGPNATRRRRLARTVVLQPARDLDDRIVAIRRVRARGTESGAETESAVATMVDFKNNKGIRIRIYLDLDEALEAAGLSE
jgi:ketosteroid isomerase-like protein